MEERNLQYNEEIQGLYETLEILKQNIRKLKEQKNFGAPRRVSWKKIKVAVCKIDR